MLVRRTLKCAIIQYMRERNRGEMKKLKQLLAAVLVLSIALNTPVCMETAAAKQTRRRIPRPVDSSTIQEPSVGSPENAVATHFS